MPDFLGNVVERRMAIDLGFRRLEHHALLGGIGGRDRARRHDPGLIASQPAIIQIPKKITVSDRMITSVSIEGHQCVRCSFMACPSAIALCYA